MGIFSVNNDPKKIIEIEVKKEFKDSKINNRTYVSLQNSIIKCLPNDQLELKEEKIETEQEILYLEMYNFENFAGLRLGLYAYELAIVALVFSNSDLLNKFGMAQPELWILGFIIFGIFLCITIRETTDYQKHRLLYLKFKLQCIDKIFKQ